MSVIRGRPPSFDWTPKCGVAVLTVEKINVFEEGEWALQTDPARGHPNIIAPRVTYGVEPPNARQTMLPQVLLADTIYTVTVYFISHGTSVWGGSARWTQ